MYTVRCSCGKYVPDDFGSVELAETASKMHVMLGEEHVITCTRPAHFKPRGVPVVVFTCRLEQKAATENSPTNIRLAY